MSRERRPVTRLCASLARRDRGSVGRIAALCDVDRSTVSHWFAEDAARDYSVPSDQLAAVCDALGSVEPLRVIADELDLEIVPRSRPTTSLRAVEDGVWELLGRAAQVGTEVRQAVSDGRLDPDETTKVRTALQSLRDVVLSMLARLPEGA